MKNKTFKIGLAAVIMWGIFFVVLWRTNTSEPRYVESDWDNVREDDSSYDDAYEYSGSSSNSSGSNSLGNSNSSGSSLSGGDSKSTDDSSNSALSTPKSFSGSTKSYSELHGWDSYDEGYDDIYMGGYYDEDRYDSDDDYASGVDDAMDDEWEEYGEEW